MKYILKLSLILVLIIFYQSTAKEIKLIEIKTPTVQCGMCKKTIEKELNNTDGIISSDVDYKAKVTEIKFDANKITPQEIREVISKAGYDADNIKADEKAYSKLMKCCKLPKDRK